MHKLKILWLALLVIVFLASAQSRDVGQGVIQGFVLGEGGQPVGGAKVHAELKGGPAMKAIRCVETDESGFFLIDRLDFGSYYIGAMKEEDGYGSIDSSFFNDNPIPTAQISVRYRFADLVVNLGVKAGILTGTISDALTGKTHTGRFRLSAGERPQQWMGTSAGPSFRVLIPSLKQVEVKVSAPGYETWLYPDVLRMDPGSEIHLDVRLKPARDQNLPISKFLIPEGYVGWLRVEHDVECTPTIPVEDAVRVFRFTGASVLETSSSMPEDRAARQYFYYAVDGSERELATEYRSGKGMIWQERPGTRAGKPRMFMFFVGTEEQSSSRPLPGFPAPSCQ